MALQLTPDMEQRLEHLAALQNRSPDEVAIEGLEQFLSYEESIYTVSTRGRADSAAGRLLDIPNAIAILKRAGIGNPILPGDEILGS